ncbi:MAG: hypothetical protein J0H64_10315 [Actinobacteria bacterium]|nr:hypothetical protein [Actinomycetota bacterium]
MTHGVNPTPAAQDPILVAACDRALESLRTQCRSLQVAAFATDDGFEVTRRPASAEQDQRLASMASSLQALTEAVAHDRTLGESQYTLLEAERGRVLLRRVPGQKLMLLAVFGTEEQSGLAISISRGVLAQLGDELALARR